MVHRLLSRLEITTVNETFQCDDKTDCEWNAKGAKAVIEAFATQEAHEQSEFENGEK